MKTYPQARTEILEYLNHQTDWKVHIKHAHTFQSLKVPYVINPRLCRIEFHAQAVYANGHSLFVDIRSMTPQEFEFKFRDL